MPLNSPESGRGGLATLSTSDPLRTGGLCRPLPAPLPTSAWIISSRKGLLARADGTLGGVAVPRALGSGGGGACFRSTFPAESFLSLFSGVPFFSLLSFSGTSEGFVEGETGEGGASAAARGGGTQLSASHSPLPPATSAYLQVDARSGTQVIGLRVMRSPRNSLKEVWKQCWSPVGNGEKTHRQRAGSSDTANGRDAAWNEQRTGGWGCHPRSAEWRSVTPGTPPARLSTSFGTAYTSS